MNATSTRSLVVCRLFFAVITMSLFQAGLFAQESESANAIGDVFFKAKTVAFLGDSNTYQGEFLTAMESCLIASGKECPTILNLGLSSETCSGDSEPAHPWPRPNVHERFQRVLEKAKPDLIFVNYGMNDGIYHPFDAERFERYKAGINKIIEAADNSNGDLKVVLVTPPPFDPVPVRLKNGLATKDADDFSWKAIYENYDSEVMVVYSNWILEQEGRVLACVDLRTPILEALAEKRKDNPEFRFAHDGVHADSNGQKLVGAALAKSIGVDPSKTLSTELYQSLRQRQILMRDSWLSEIGHKRPGIKPGIPLKEATQIAKTIDGLIKLCVTQQESK